ncbi:hypothetical protein [Endozoicomonas lisbonensis]|uniref:Uncharacterized protein n=1 Tax=Endozoicomonas lisbonensis TaxID=3120522 RepID=A0ABV2SBN8_9GAMM
MEIFCDQMVMYKYLFLFILVCLMASRAGAQNYVLYIQAKETKARIYVDLINDVEDESASPNWLWGFLNYYLSRRSGEVQAAVPPEEYEMNGYTYQSLSDAGPGGGLQGSDQSGAAVPESSETDVCPAEIVRQTVSSESVDKQPEALRSLHGVMVSTGNVHVSAWLEDGSPGEESQESPVFRVPGNRVEEFTRLMVSLMGMEGEQINTFSPMRRLGKYVFDSSANPRWKWGRWIAPFVGLAASGGAYAGFSLGVNGLGAGCVTTGAMCTPASTWFLGYTPFSSVYQIRFSFRWSSLPVTWEQITYLRQVASMLQCTGEYDLVASSLTSLTRQQDLTFRARMPAGVSADQLVTWLENLNRQYGSRFSIDVRPVSE